jgi:hypothetical protein
MSVVDASDANDFTTKLSYWIPQILSASLEEEYLATSLSLSTLLRNFTSHLLVENLGLSRHQYLRCVRAVLAATFLISRVAQSRGWR